MTVSTCSQCYRPLAPGDDVCANCGAFVVAASSKPKPMPAYPQGNVSIPASPTPTLCPTCRKPVQPGDDICDYCGAILASVSSGGGNTPQHNGNTATTCPACLAPVKPNDEFCDHCGAVLAAVAVATPQPANAAQQAVPPPASTGQEVCPRCNVVRRFDKKFCGQCGYHFPPGQGEVLGNKYHLDKMIGSGGMGAVWLAEDIVLHRKVVIKALLNNDDPDLVAQSVKEREFLARLNHSNIVSIYDCIAQGNEGYIVMEYIHGKTLEELLEERQAPFPVPEAITYILGILPAFAYLAKLNMVYCDFKPPNIMIEMREDGVQTPKLIDLGTVIKYGPKPDRVYGTHGFYAREAVKSPSPQTDLYSICRTLAFLVTLMDIDKNIFGLPQQNEYSEFQQYPALYRLLYKGTHSDPARRFQSAEELEEQLRGVLRLCAGGAAGVAFESRKFVSAAVTSTGRLGRRAETALDEQDRSLRQLSFGDQALQNGNYTGAINFYQQALSTNPQSIDAYARLIDTFIEQEHVQDAEQILARAPQNSISHWKARWSQARLYETRQEWSQAEQVYQDLMLDLPGELPPLQALARVYARQGKTREAVQVYEYVLKADPTNVDTLFAISDCLISQRRWDDALRHLGSVSEASARYTDAQVLLCDIYVHRSLPGLPSETDIARATAIVSKLKGHLSDARYYLLRGEVYYLAWQLARQGLLPASTVLADATHPGARDLGNIAESSYKQYLRSDVQLAPREEVIRRKFEVTSWRF
ncbi:MAG TPA: tetratricopeptide repeat protein [Ktedonobacteraceae bacterium]